MICRTCGTPIIWDDLYGWACVGGSTGYCKDPNPKPGIQVPAPDMWLMVPVK